MSGPASSPRSARAVLGAVGEEAAAERYRARGFDVLACNWRCPAGEIDVIATRRDLLVICEVKTRREAGSGAFGGGYEAVTARKQRKLRQLAELYLRATDADAHGRAVRFDVASVTVSADGLVDVELSEDAF